MIYLSTLLSKFCKMIPIVAIKAADLVKESAFDLKKNMNRFIW